HVTPAELGAHRVAGRECDDHVDHHRQQRAEQKLRVVARRVDQYDCFGNERPDVLSLWRRGCGRALDGSREAIAETRCSDAGGSEELLVIEGNHLRAPPRLQIALEIIWYVDSADGVARADRPSRRSHVTSP